MRNIGLALLASLSIPSPAATIVEQKMTLRNGKGSSQEHHTWTIDKRKFRLSAKLKDRQIDYIFNGRTLLACLKSTEKTFRVDIEDKKMAEAFRKLVGGGICTTVPITIETSFFISPHSAVSALDATESLELGIQLASISSEKKTTSKVLAKECTTRQRQFSYTYPSFKRKEKLTISGNELSCELEGPGWRPVFWRELKKSLLRQPKARSTRNLLKKSEIAAEGVALSKTGTYEISDAGGKKIATLMAELSTTAIENRKARSRDFRAPVGYKVVSSFGQALKDSTKQKQKRKKRPKKDSEEGISPLFFTHFLGLPI